MITPVSKSQLDHVVLLLPYRDIIDPPSWITDHFTISPGGVHADGKTENKLIFFEDGTYLELIAFIHDDEARRRGHWWDKPFGIVDYALTSSAPLDHAALNDRLEKTGTGISYKAPQEGGREKPDSGILVQWEVTFPQGAPRGALPFWCHDITPREWRVPVENNSKGVSHPCGAKGISCVHVELPSEQISSINSAIVAITDSDLGESMQLHKIRSPRLVEGLREPCIALQETFDSEGADMLLTLVCQRGAPQPLSIRRQYEHGVVSIALI